MKKWLIKHLSIIKQLNMWAGGGGLNPHPHLIETWNYECNFFIAPSSGHNTSKLIAGKTEIPRD